MRLASIALLCVVFLSTVSCSTPTYRLSTAVNGQGNIMPSSGDFMEGRTITVLANPAYGWQFDHWEGALSGSQNPANMIMNSDKNITAYFAVSNGSTTPTETSEFTTYTNSSMGFSIPVPASWMTMAMGGIAVFVSDSMTCIGSSVNVIATETSGLSLDDMHEAALTVAHTFSGSTIISDQETTVDGVPAIEMIYSWGSEEDDIQTMQCYLTKGGMDWVITCTSSPDCWYIDIGTFNTMISSFHVLD